MARTKYNVAATTSKQISVCLELTRAIGRARTLDEIYAAALDAVRDGLGVSRASIRLVDPDGVMRFKAFRGVSEAYRTVASGYAAWAAGSPDPQPIVESDVTSRPSLKPLLPALANEGIAAMTCIPLVSLGRVIGKLGLYYAEPGSPSNDDLQLAGVIGAEVAFAIERARAEDHARRNEERLRFALDAALMGTWEWELPSKKVRWSENLERIHGLPPGTFDGTFESYEREIHPDDRDRVFASLRRAIEEGVPHDVEYRILLPDGQVRWVEGKGRVEFEQGTPVRMAGVCMVVSRRKEAELARLASAEEASRLKDEFLATLSHELRTPLNAILGWVQMLQGDHLSSEKARHAIAVIGRNAKLQAQLIEDILDVSRIITGKLEIDRRPLRITQLVDDVLSGLQPEADAKRIQLSREIPEDLPVIDGDAKRLQQVFFNIVSNAIKFTPEHGRVSVVGCGDASLVAIQVRDSGVGIDADFLPFVFDRFRQADSRLARMHGGLGLGLAIARHLLELHGGQIRASSAGLGQGTTFEIRLPSQPVAVVQVTPPSKHATPLHLHGLRVVVVDDHADSREFLAALLDGCGADVVRCDSAASTLDALVSTPVHLIVADLGMPEVDGFDLIDQVRRMENGSGRAPAIAVSAYSRPEYRDKALAVGYSAYCSKPVDAFEFLRVVDQVLKASGAGSRAQ